MPDSLIPTAIVDIQINQPKQVLPDTKPDINQLLSWREEAMVASSDWRSESWRDCEMYDGEQWSDEDKTRATEAGLTYQLTINRTFPTVNLILGSQILNKYDIIAKGRTNKDGEISQVMTEGIKYVMDQWDGDFKVSLAFRDAVIPGVGFVVPGLSNDPRKERVKLSYRDWKEVWWDAYSSPWVDPDTCRYVFHQRWMDVIDLQSLFPEKKQEIEEGYNDFSGGLISRSSTVYDEATQKEEVIQSVIGTGWVIPNRKRIRPCEMWYTHYETCMFAIYPDSNVLEVRPDLPPLQQFAMITSASEVVTATVKKIRVATFLGNLLLADIPSPFKHDMFPFIPFVGYLDRYNRPYGIPRQLRDQEEEINRRRSMALRLISSRRIFMEEDAISETQTIDQLYEEANKPDGFLIVRPGAISSSKIKIEEQSRLAPEQMALLEQSEREVQQISGANAESMGYKSNTITGVAQEKRIQQGSVVTASLYENLRRSLNILGYQVTSLIQNEWRGEKVLRITDRLSGADRFVELNKRVPDGNGNVVINNDVTQGKVDIVISQAPMTDTTREMNMMMIIEWIKKSPPEIIPQLLLLAFEMSDVPNKDQVLARLKPLLGQDPRDEDLTPTQIKQKAVANIDAQSQKKAIIEQLELEAAKYDVESKRLMNEKITVEIQKLLNAPLIENEKLNIAHRKVDVSNERIRLDGMRTGIQSQEHSRDQDLEESKHLLDIAQANRQQSEGDVNTPAAQ